MDVRITARVFRDDGPRTLRLVVHVPDGELLPELTPEQLEELLAVSFDEDQQAPRVAGMPEDHLEALAPRERYSHRLMGPVTCAVCLEEYTSRTRRHVRRLACGHTFCSGCIAKWVNVCASCPTCRKDVEPH